MGVYGYGGEMDTVIDNASYLYARAEMTSSFHYICDETRASSVKREVVWVRPETTDGPSVLVVRDLVTRLEAEYTVKATYHTWNRPEPMIGGNCACARVIGAPWADDLGGVYEMPRDRSLSIVAGDSEAQLFVLTPGNYSGRVRLTGGPNSDGIYWKQDWQSGCANYSAGKTSYEFYVNGYNYVGHNDPAIRRSDPGREACDWKVEIEAPATGTAVELIYAFVCGAATQDRATATLTTAGGVKRVEVTQGASVVQVDFTVGGYFSTAVRP
jgi:hypothetical protein